MLNTFLDEILKHKNPKIAQGNSRFFKTQKGDYGYGDIFLGVPAPILRKIAKNYSSKLSLCDIQVAFKNKYHEIRACALMTMILQYKQTKNTIVKQQIYETYITHLDFINNWDLVDISATHIVGDYLYNYDYNNAEEILTTFANTNHLWTQRVSIVATHYFIKQKHYDITFKLATIFLTHNHDLMHKAVGWMLREVGKQEKIALKSFLQKHSIHMPRTMLRYTIEKLKKKEREKFLSTKHKSLS